MENGTSTLFGLPGVAVVRVERAAEDGEIVRLVHLTTVVSSAAGCPVCGVISTSVRQYRTTRPRDLPYGEERLAVRWHKRQYRCREEACPRKAFTESVPEIPARARLTGRLCRKAAAEVASGRSVSAVAAEYRVSWPVIHRHYPAYADQLLTEPDPPVVLGIDETRRGAPKWVHDAGTGRWVRTERFETNFTDLAGQGRLLGQVAGRTGKTVTRWLDDRGQDWKDQVRFVAIDPCAEPDLWPGGAGRPGQDRPHQAAGDQAAQAPGKPGRDRQPGTDVQRQGVRQQHAFHPHPRLGVQPLVHQL